MLQKWTVLGYDTFSEEYYHIPGGTYPNKEEALKAARKYLEEIERDQPSEESGGQDGIQDHVYVVSPEGIRIRVLYSESEQDSLIGYA